MIADNRQCVKPLAVVSVPDRKLHNLVFLQCIKFSVPNEVKMSYNTVLLVVSALHSKRLE
jgi:hypothetical protein